MERSGNILRRHSSLWQKRPQAVALEGHCRYILHRQHREENRTKRCFSDVVFHNSEGPFIAVNIVRRKTMLTLPRLPNARGIPQEPKQTHQATTSKNRYRPNEKTTRGTTTTNAMYSITPDSTPFATLQERTRFPKGTGDEHCRRDIPSSDNSQL